MRKFGKAAATISAVALSVGLLSGCGGNDKRDLEGISSYDPDYAEVYNNTDGRPNVVLLCIRGVGFASTTVAYSALKPIPQWDEFCSNFESHKIDPGQFRKNG